MSVAENIRKFRAMVPEEVEIVAVSKFHPTSMILEAYNAGQKVFGESRVQEFIEKEKTLPKDINWHFIGHLQTNKVKQIIGKTKLIESVDSLKLLKLINEESQKAGITTEVLLQIHVAMEETKFGFLPEELKDLLANNSLSELQNIKVRGIMGMASNTNDEERVKRDFETLYSLYVEVRSKYLPDKYFNKLSMGMSGDWQLAVKEGSNIVRIGSAIFGERIYS